MADIEPILPRCLEASFFEANQNTWLMTPDHLGASKVKIVGSNDALVAPTTSTRWMKIARPSVANPDLKAVYIGITNVGVTLSGLADTVINTMTGNGFSIESGGGVWLAENGDFIGLEQASGLPDASINKGFFLGIDNSGIWGAAGTVRIYTINGSTVSFVTLPVMAAPGDEMSIGFSPHYTAIFYKKNHGINTYSGTGVIGISLLANVRAHAIQYFGDASFAASPDFITEFDFTDSMAGQGTWATSASMVDFPPVGMVAKPDSAKYSMTGVNASMKFETDGGYLFSRARHTGVPKRKYSLGFTNISEDDKVLFLAFWDAQKGGSEIFSFMDWGTGDVVNVRFASEPVFNYSGIGNYKRWNVDNVVLERV